MRTLLAVLLLGTIGCTGSPTEPAGVRTVTLRFGETASVSGTRITFTDVTVRVYGDVGVLTGFVDVKMVGRESFRVRTLQVYTQSDGKWQLAAHQSTRLSN